MGNSTWCQIPTHQPFGPQFCNAHSQLHPVSFKSAVSHLLISSRRLRSVQKSAEHNVFSCQSAFLVPPCLDAGYVSFLLPQQILLLFTIKFSFMFKFPLVCIPGSKTSIQLGYLHFKHKSYISFKCAQTVSVHRNVLWLAALQEFKKKIKTNVFSPLFLVFQKKLLNTYWLVKCLKSYHIKGKVTVH